MAVIEKIKGKNLRDSKDSKDSSNTNDLKKSRNGKNIRKNLWWIAVAFIAVTITVLLIAFFPLQKERKLARELSNTITATQNLSDIMLVSNFRFDFHQNGKSNKTVTQGAYVSTDKNTNVLLKGNIQFESELNSANDFETSFDVLKKGNSIFEKNANKYVESDITEKEFSELHQNFEIYNFQYSQVESIRKSESVDKSSAIYEVTLNKIPKTLQKNYIEIINEATGEKFTEKDIKVNSVQLISNVSKEILRSQQLKISLEAKSKTNFITIGYLSEINITDDKDAIQSQFAE